MATETLYATSHLAGTFVTPENAVGNTPTTWAGELNANVNVTSRWAIGDPVNPLTAGATHTVLVAARKGSNSGTPTIALNLFENGVLVQSLVGATNVTSTTGQTISGTFTTSTITSGNDIEIEAVMVSVGGSGTARNSAQVATISLTADTTAVVPPTTRTVTDPVGVTDSGLVNTTSATGLDWVGLTDAVAVTLGASSSTFSRTVVDPAALTDTTTVALGHARPTADTVGLTDTTTPAVAAARTAVDPLGLTDATTSTVGSERGITDAVGVTDTTSAPTGVARTATDPVGLTDTASSATVAGRAISDTVAVTDSGTASGVAVVGHESVGLSDAASVVLTAGVAGGLTRTVLDTVAVTDSGTASDPADTLTDSAGLTDTVTPTTAGTGVRSVTDSESLTDAVALTRTGTVTDPLGVTDTTSTTSAATTAHNRTVVDAEGLTDTTAGTLSASGVPPGAVSALPQRRPESALLRAIRGPHNVLASAQWSNDGATWHDATVTSGSVTADRTAQVRWTANAALAGTALGRKAINPISTRVRLSRGVVVPRQGTLWSPWGTYAVTDANRTKTGLGVELKGLEQVLQAAGFLAPRQVGGDTARNVVAQLVHEVLPDVGISWRTGVDPDQYVPTIIEDSDRWKVLAGGADDTSVAGALGAEIFFDSGGTLVVAPVPTLADPPVWTVDTGAGGVQVDVSESLSADGVFNVVASVGERADGSAPVGPGYAWDDNPTSLTFAGPDPVRDPLAPGRLGLTVRLLTRTYASPLLTTLGQCQKSSASILADSLGLSASLGFTAVTNPSLAPGNVVDVEDLDGRLAPHLVDSWTADLTGISMSCRTRTTTRRL